MIYSLIPHLEGTSNRKGADRYGVKIHPAGSCVPSSVVERIGAFVFMRAYAVAIMIDNGNIQGGFTV